MPSNEAGGKHFMDTASQHGGLPPAKRPRTTGHAWEQAPYPAPTHSPVTFDQRSTPYNSAYPGRGPQGDEHPGGGPGF